MLEATSIVLGSVGTVTTIWALVFARLQARKLTTLRRNEVVALWSSLDRVGTMINQIEVITRRKGQDETNGFSPDERHMISKVDKGLHDQYIRLVELYVKKCPSLTASEVLLWRETGMLNSDWRANQFLNLLCAVNGAQ